MKMQNVPEHLMCSNYDGGKRPLIEIIKMNEGHSFMYNTNENCVFFVTEGVVEVSFNRYKNDEIEKGKFFILTSGERIYTKAKVESEVVMVRLLDKPKFCECYPMEQLYKEKSESIVILQDDDKVYCSNINKVLWPYLKALTDNISNGLKCRYFFETKSKELFYLLRGYYSKAELRKLFHLMLTNDTTFSEQVRINAMKYKTATELANSMHYTLSGFNKKFRSVFGMPAYQWMLEQKKEHIYRELRSGNKNLKMLCFELGFCSPSNFSSFCKRYFGQTPGEIRNVPEE